MSSMEESMQLVFFDLETSGLDKNAEVLQIAMKYCYIKFNTYMKPMKSIPPEASRVNNFTMRNDELYYKNTEKLSTVPKRLALKRLLQYLRDFEQPCVLIAHNCPFDTFYLMRIIKEEGLLNEFRAVIAGFTDTLEMLRRKFPERRSKGQLKLTTLAAELSLSTVGAHDARCDAHLLEKIALFHFTKKQLVENRISFADVLLSHMN